MPRYSEDEARRVIAASTSYTDALRRLGMRAAGGNYRTIRRYAEEIWQISVDHFDPDGVRKRALVRRPIPLAQVLVEGSTYNRTKLKRRLYDEGIKSRVCELCGQGESWHGRAMSLILDHVNGVPDDNRINNLRIVCPNCAATLETHCGRQNRLIIEEEHCARCGTSFLPRGPRHRYCSRACGMRAPRSRDSRPERRRVVRPPYIQLLREIRALGYLGVGRRYGVSDNAIRKWVRIYERDRARSPEVLASTMPA